MPSLNRERLRELIAERGTTPRAVSRAVGAGKNSNDYLVRDILSGKSKNPRSDTLAKIADHLRVPLAELIIDQLNSDTWDIKLVPSYLTVRHRVQAGLWHEVGTEEPITPFDHPVAPNPRFAEWPQWLEEIVGDSANKRIPPGHYAHVVDAKAMGYAPQHGHWVIVERRRDGGRLRERTIKQVEVRADGVIELWPRSTNPMWQTPVELIADANPEDVEVEVVGLVIGAYDPSLMP